jgi:hypothetical protein
MKFVIVPFLGNVKGVFKNLYNKYGPFPDDKTAREFAKENKAEIAFYVESNRLLYILKQEVKDGTKSIGNDFGGGAKPKPETKSEDGGWFKTD